LSRELIGSRDRNRIVAETLDHLYDAAEAETLDGCEDPVEAERRAVARFGDPAVVARAFFGRSPSYVIAGRWKPWLPVSSATLAVAAGALAAIAAGHHDSFEHRAAAMLGVFALAPAALVAWWAVQWLRGRLVWVESAQDIPSWAGPATRELGSTTLLALPLIALPVAPWVVAAATGSLITASVIVSLVALARMRPRWQGTAPEATIDESQRRRSRLVPLASTVGIYLMVLTPFVDALPVGALLLTASIARMLVEVRGQLDT